MLFNKAGWQHVACLVAALAVGGCEEVAPISAACDSRVDCPLQWTCLGGRCVRECDTSAACPTGGHRCVDGVCLEVADAECRFEAQCRSPGAGFTAQGATCQEGRCIYAPEPCGTSSDCPAGMTCGDAGTCIAISLCGNGVLDAGEECDGSDLGGASCFSVLEGVISGTLRCSPACVYDAAECVQRSMDLTSPIALASGAAPAEPACWTHSSWETVDTQPQLDLDVVWWVSATSGDPTKGIASLGDVTQGVVNLNAVLGARTGIRFVLGGYNIIAAIPGISGNYGCSSIASFSDWEALTQRHHQAGALNIIVAPNLILCELLDDGSCSCTGAAGWSLVPGQPGSAVAMRADYVMSLGVLNQEVGHFLGLQHTHEDCGGSCVDTGDPSTCYSLGDRICDTPADPGLCNQRTACCVEYENTCSNDCFAAAAIDVAGSLVNVMSYYPETCTTELTPEQGRMARCFAEKQVWFLFANCGDGICESNFEGPCNCPSDCAAQCGDGCCSSPAEDSASCSADCLGSDGCNNECPQSGVFSCSADGRGLRVCGNYNNDPCLEWSATYPCQSGVCSSGLCTAPCSNECSAAGITRCSGTGGQETCGNYDADSCLEWSSAAACTSGLCSGNTCVTCSNECAVAGATRCNTSSSQQTCGNFDGDNCLEWSTPASSCSSGVCSGSACVGCANDCNTNGEKQCYNASQERTCGNYDGDTCLEWGTATTCASGVCSGSACAACANECSFSGQKQCASGSQERTCGNYDGDSCLEWGAPSSCSSGVCASGACQACSNECAFSGQKECVSGSQERTCGNHDGDSCLEWGTPSSCSSGVCSGGSCQTCSDLCTPNTYRCNGNVIEACGTSHDPDTCYEWGAVTDCWAQVGMTCHNGACIPFCPENPIAAYASSPDLPAGGSCNESGVLTDGGAFATIYGSTTSYSVIDGISVSDCIRVDFGELCRPWGQLEIEMYAGAGGCSDSVGTAACYPGASTAMDLFTNGVSSQTGASYYATYDVVDWGSACIGDLAEPIRWVYVCRSSCPANAYNLMLDWVGFTSTCP